MTYPHQDQYGRQQPQQQQQQPQNYYDLIERLVTLERDLYHLCQTIERLAEQNRDLSAAIRGERTDRQEAEKSRSAAELKYLIGAILAITPMLGKAVWDILSRGLVAGH